MLETGVLPFPGFLKPLTLQEQPGTRAHQQAMILMTKKTREENTTCFGVNLTLYEYRAAQPPDTEHDGTHNTIDRQWQSLMAVPVQCVPVLCTPGQRQCN